MVSKENDNVMEELGLIAQGTYGKVFKIYDHKKKRFLARKERILYKSSRNKGIPDDVIGEITILKNVCFPLIAKPVHIKINSINSKFELFFEFYEFDLNRFYKSQNLREDDIIKIMFNLLSAVTYLHSNRILHRDIKPQNILIHENKFALSDFGLARVFDLPLRKYNKLIGTQDYRSPEIIFDSKNGDELYSTGVDIWAVGCTAMELVLNQRLFKTKNDLELKKQQIILLGQENFSQFNDVPFVDQKQPKIIEIFNKANISQDFADLLIKLLDPNQFRRIEAIEALEHPVFKKYVDLKIFYSKFN